MANRLRFIREVDGLPVADLLELQPGDVIRVGSDGRLERVSGFHATTGTPVNAAAATGSLTLANNPTAGENLVIGSKTYTFVASGQANVDGEIALGGNAAATQAAVVAAINGSDGVNTQHPTVSAGAFNTNVSTITARTRGAAGNAIATTDTLAGGGDGFGAATLANGVNGTIGTANQMVRDNSYLYLAIADNGITDQNWRRISLGAAY